MLFLLALFPEFPYIVIMKTYSRDEVVDMLKKLQGKRSIRIFARDVMISAPYLSDIFNGNREPGPKILNLLKLAKRRSVTVVYMNARKDLQK